MPDLSLRVDEKTLKKLVELMNDVWPNDFAELFGSVNDETFVERPGDICCADTVREDL
jgi:hypothetical protein